MDVLFVHLLHHDKGCVISILAVVERQEPADDETTISMLVSTPLLPLPLLHA
jgi:hypothetical protein